MKKQSRYIILLGGLLIVFILVQLLAPKPLDWSPTFLPSDKNPFGAYVTQTLFEPFFGKKTIHTNELTLYELQDSIRPGENIISISNRFNADDESTKVLLDKVDSGSTAFISAYYFSGKLADTLKLFTSDVILGGLAKLDGGSDSTDLKLVSPGIEKRGYYYRLDNVSFYFSTLDSITRPAFIISTNAWNKPVTLRIPWGNGQLIINTTPLAFTNNYLLYESNHIYASHTLSYLPVADTWWTSYYQVGRQEAATPLRFILSTESLRWAYYLTVAGIVLFILFESKRKQRIIPIVRPLANTTLEFVRTIGNMYLHASAHKAIAEKKITFFMEQMRSNYFLSSETGDAFVELIAKKSGNALEDTQQLFALIKVVQTAPSISEQLLSDLNVRMENFTRVKYQVANPVAAKK